VCDLNTTGAPSIIKIIRSSAVLARIFSNLGFDLCGERGAAVVEPPRRTRNSRYKGDNVRGIVIIVNVMFSDPCVCLFATGLKKAKAEGKQCHSKNYEE
jgi:hypothetical protein